MLEGETLLKRILHPTQWSKPSMGNFYVLCIVVIFAAYMRMVQSGLQLPITAATIAAGFATGLFLNTSALLQENVAQFADLNMTRFNVLYLPTLLYTVTIFLKKEIFWKSFFHSLLLGVLGLGICTLMQAAVMYMYDRSYTAVEALMLGLVQSYQEPIFIKDFNLLMSVKSHILETLVVAESLVGTSVFAYVYFLYTDNVVFSLPGALRTLFANVVGGYLLGQFSGSVLGSVLMRRFKEAQIVVIMAFIFVFFTFHIAQSAFYGAGVVAVVSMGLNDSAGEYDFLLSFWISMRFILSSTLTFLASVKVGREVSHSMQPVAIQAIVIAYTTKVFSRLMMVSLTFPILSQTGYRISWRQALVLAWLSHKGALMVSLGVSDIIQDETETTTLDFGVRKLGTTFLVSTFNCTLIPLILDKLGTQADVRSDVVYARRARSVIRNALDRSRRFQRRQPVFSGADWLWVQSATQLSCSTDPQDSPRGKAGFQSLREMRHLMADTSQNIMRIQMLSFSKQYREGMIHRKTHTKLAAIMQHPVERGVCLDVNIMRSSVRPPAYLHTLKRILNKLLPAGEGRTIATDMESLGNTPRVSPASPARQRRERRRRLFNKMATSPLFLLCSSLTAAAFLFALQGTVVLDEYVPQDTSETVSLSLEGFYFIIFTVELWVQMQAHGLYWMWTVPFVRLDGVLYVLYCVEYIFAVITDWLGHRRNLFTGFTATFLSAIFFVRFARLFQQWKEISQEVLRLLDRTLDCQLFLLYDLGWAYIKAEEEIMSRAGRFAGGPTLAGTIRNHAAADKLAILREVTALQQKYPYLEAATKSRQAARRILNDVRTGLQDLKEGGLIDHPQYGLINKNLTKMATDVAEMPRGVTSDSSLRSLLIRVPWIPKRNLPYFCQRCPVVHYEKGIVIIEKNLLPKEVYILCSGVVRIEGHADEFRVRDMIANSDSTHYYSGSGLFTDYMTVPSTIGLLGFLNKSPSVCEVSCETDVDLCRISFEVLHEVSEASYEPPGIVYRMWQCVAVRIGLNLLVQHRRYIDWTHDHIKHFLESGVMPDLLHASHFSVDPSVVDVLLIQGHLCDDKGKRCFQGPAYVPEYMREVVLLGTIGVRARPVILMTTATNILLPPLYDWYSKLHQFSRYDISSRDRPLSLPSSPSTPSSRSKSPAPKINTSL